MIKTIVVGVDGTEGSHRALEWTAERATELHARVPYRSYVVEESAAHALVHVAEREHADLLVLGAHGHGSFTDRLLGSVSYSVSHAAPCPVVIIPAEARAA